MPWSCRRCWRVSWKRSANQRPRCRRCSRSRTAVPASQSESCAQHSISGEYDTGSVLDDDGWFCTQDRGSVDADGYRNRLAGLRRPAQDPSRETSRRSRSVDRRGLRRHRQNSAQTTTQGAAAGGLAFCGPDGQPLHPERVYQAFRRALIRHKLPTIPLHGLRHAWATIALQTGTHPRVMYDSRRSSRSLNRDRRRSSNVTVFS